MDSSTKRAKIDDFKTWYQRRMIRLPWTTHHTTLVNYFFGHVFNAVYNFCLGIQLGTREIGCDRKCSRKKDSRAITDKADGRTKLNETSFSESFITAQDRRCLIHHSKKITIFNNGETNDRKEIIHTRTLSAVFIILFLVSII